MEGETPREVRQLLRAIGRGGDALWAGRLSAIDRETGYAVPFDDAPEPSWSLLWKLDDVALSGKWPETLVICVGVPLFPLLLAVDAVHFVLRLCLYPLAVGVWWLERSAAIWLGRTCVCPVCRNLMEDPLVYCPNEGCWRVQSRLKPTLHSLFFRTCAGCGQTRWPIFGQRFLQRPAPLVCRDTPKGTGCYRPHRVPVLSGRSAATHVALVGTSVRAKHATFGHLVGHLTNVGDAEQQFAPGWELSRLELALSDRVLRDAFERDTSEHEQPGKKYTLARTFVLRSGRGRLAVFHNIVQQWLARTDDLAREDVNWRLIDTILLVIDGEQFTCDAASAPLPPSEVYSRLLLVLEEYCSLPPAASLPCKVAVVIVSPATVPRYQPGEAEALLRRADPALHGLLKRTVAKASLRFFAGALLPGEAFERPGWLGDLLAWIV